MRAIWMGPGCVRSSESCENQGPVLGAGIMAMWWQCAWMVVALFLWWQGGPAYAALEAVLDPPSEVDLGETFVLTVKVEGSLDKKLTVPAVDGLSYSSVSTSRYSSRNLFDNTRKSTFTMTVVITPERSGAFTIPAFDVHVDGSTERVGPLTLRVLAPVAPTRQEVAEKKPAFFITRDLKDPVAYIHEPVSESVNVYFRKHKLEDVGIEEINHPGVVSYNTGKPVLREESVGGVLYQVLTYHRVLIPIQSGQMELEPVHAMVKFLSTQPSSSFPSGFFSTQSVVQKPLVSEPAFLGIYDLPAQGKPKTFTGFVGEMELTASSQGGGPSEVKVQDSVVVSLIFEGKGWLSSLKALDPQFPPAFKVYPDKPLLEEAVSQDGISGKKTFSYVLVAMQQGEHDLGVYEWSYFDRQSESYRRLAVDLGRIHVTSSPQVSSAVADAQQDAGGSDGGSDELLSSQSDQPFFSPAAQDIMDRKRDNFAEAVSVRSLLRSSFVSGVLLVLIWLLVFLVAAVRVLERYRGREARQWEYGSERYVQVWVEKVKAACQEQAPERFFEAMAWHARRFSHASQESAITAYDIKKSLQDLDLTEEQREELARVCVEVESQRAHQEAKREGRLQLVVDWQQMVSWMEQLRFKESHTAL